MTRATWRVAALLFCSGACALIYQTSWLRQFRTIFGTSTFATAAVLAIFMGGLGIGSALLGRRADAHGNPLRLYGMLEIGIAVSAAITPLILLAVRAAYIATGGSATSGLLLATVVRLLLSALVLAVPTILMGGTLPAAARAVETSDDAGRKRLALLYGANTLGAVTGTLVSSFYLLEHLGNRGTLLGAAVLNAIVGLVAILAGRGSAAPVASVAAPRAAHDEQAPRRFVLVAAFTTGFAFLLMELVWYRMLSPLLGGTTFMFGLILAVALAGIGLGGAAYSFWTGGGSASAGGFALTCTLEALAVIVPFALGDRLALATLLMRPLGVIGFSGHVLAWTLITSVVVFPAAFISGVQFPIMISLLGRGGDAVGRDVGHAYAWNTAGAIAGSLLGGFGLLPLLSATGAWQLVAYVLALLGLVAVMHTLRARQRGYAAVAVVAALAAILCTRAMGPTAPWRHSGIGAGRANNPSNAAQAKDINRRERRSILWEADGRESSIALNIETDLSLIVNGKSDGTARADAGTQVMSAMVPALVAPQAKSCAVVGLGTGTTAGWLAALPAMERVEVVELEPMVIEAAREYATVNRDVLRSPKVHVTVGDAREILVASPARYDIIFSEPSNPYRAGIASLYTREFYRSAANRLNPNGIFAQWVQTYGADASTIRTVYATLLTAFAHVETWWTTSGDLLLIATQQPLVYDTNELRRRIAEEPFRSALHVAWRVETLEGVFAHFVASDAVAARIARGAELNTDDRQVIEFSFARALNDEEFSTDTLYAAAQRLGGARPARLRGAVDWAAAEATRALEFRANDPHYALALAYRRRELGQAYDVWRKAGPWTPVSSGELMMIAMVLADANDPEAPRYIDALRRFEPIEADAITGRLLFRRGAPREAAAFLRRAFLAYRKNPWPVASLMRYGFDTALLVAGTRDRAATAALADALSKPFAEWQWDDGRRVVRLGIAEQLGGCSAVTLDALRQLEPHPPWRRHTLELRARCYAQANLGELATQARKDYEQFVREAPPGLVE
ncbi:MAG TPA: fused MFS/spermidine synthase [Thermoanaerobaculia bacterium]|jgi:spermidine synthase